MQSRLQRRFPLQLLVLLLLFDLHDQLNNITVYLHAAAGEVEEQEAEVQIDDAAEVVPPETFTVVHEQVGDRYGQRASHQPARPALGYDRRILAGVVAGKADVYSERVPADLEEKGGDAPDEEVQEDVSFQIGEERSGEDVEHGEICIGRGGLNSMAAAMRQELASPNSRSRWAMVQL